MDGETDRQTSCRGIFRAMHKHRAVLMVCCSVVLMWPLTGKDADLLQPEYNKKCGGRVRPTLYPPPPACNDTGTAFCFPNEEEAEMRCTDDVSL